jgi:hypothetical protein
MKARAKLPHRVIRAFTGREFVNYEYRPVPEGGEDEAARLVDGGYLELEPKPAPPPKPAPKPRRKRKPAAKKVTK